MISLTSKSESGTRAFSMSSTLKNPAVDYAMDLQVKVSPPIQTAPIHNDPGIIQPCLQVASLPSLSNGATPELSPNTAQLRLQQPTVHGNLPTYQTIGSFGSWGTTPPPAPANVSGLGLPMYWHGYYAPSGGLPHMPQPPFIRPHGLAMPSIQQTLQFQSMNVPLSSGAPNFSEFSSLFSSVSSTLSFGPAYLQLWLPAKPLL